MREKILDKEPTNLLELETIITQLSFNSKCKCTLIAVDKAINVWDNFASSSILNYRDTVVGLEHEVDKNLPKKAADQVRDLITSGLNDRTTSSNKTLESVLLEYLEPVVALQDLDWKLPEFALMAFYSVWNLLQAVADQTRDRNFAISINQAHEALILWDKEEFIHKCENNYLKPWWDICKREIYELRD